MPSNTKEYSKRKYTEQRDNRLEYAKSYYQKNKGKILKYCQSRKSYHLDSHLKRKYGISLEEYNFLLLKQNYCCAICNKNVNIRGYRLYVDHNHKTGEIRGLLCHYCNVALGLLGDNIQTIKNAIQYIEGGN